MLRQAFYGLILSMIFYLLFYGYTKLGLNYNFKRHYPGECRQVTGLDYGSENMEVTQDGLAFITSGMNFPPLSEKYHSFIREKNIRGTIFLYDFKNPKLGASALRFQPSKTFDPATFQPHGISLLEDKAKGEHLLYVVNHVKHGKDRVEKFKFIPRVNELQHLRFFNDSKFLILNDVALIDEDKFYASNCLFFESHFLSLFEHLLLLPLGGLLLVEGNHVTEVVKSLHGPNGVILSKDKR
ncbi:serum paraoxonase/arylesterase 2-like [Plakobranchus ocellatus]|uniref:Serum paraoxonase/arylesterase 2-like n=1 Tax=Plakobranchus ocellatus TaxID=259542 RepID=A0AAV4DXV1_9GAST|nr:serum paraoxonase/arylesterase 2-like [Plakobranchus ocellatus]